MYLLSFRRHTLARTLFYISILGFLFVGTQALFAKSITLIIWPNGTVDIESIDETSASTSVPTFSTELSDPVGHNPSITSQAIGRTGISFGEILVGTQDLQCNQGAYLEYGLTSNLGARTDTALLSSGASLHALVIPHLDAGRTYYYRPVIHACDMFVVGSTESFTTKAIPRTSGAPTQSVTVTPTPAKETPVAPEVIVEDPAEDTEVEAVPTDISLSLDATPIDQEGETYVITATIATDSATPMRDINLDVVLPKKVEFSGATDGRYIKNEHVVTTTINRVDAQAPYQQFIEIETRNTKRTHTFSAVASYEDAQGDLVTLTESISFSPKENLLENGIDAIATKTTKRGLGLPWILLIIAVLAATAWHTFREEDEEESLEDTDRA